jgi:hypothetical protein
MLLLIWKPVLLKHCLFWWCRTSHSYLIPHSARERRNYNSVKQHRNLMKSIRNIKCYFWYKIILKQYNVLQYSQSVKFHVILLYMEIFLSDLCSCLRFARRRLFTALYRSRMIWTSPFGECWPHRLIPRLIPSNSNPITEW